MKITSGLVLKYPTNHKQKSEIFCAVAGAFENIDFRRYREEANRHAMTKIRLRNTERALKQAEERNKQLQKEMEQFFESFGG